jgi:hypothetical protein
VGVLQLNEIAAACVGCMMQIFDWTCCIIVVATESDWRSTLMIFIIVSYESSQLIFDKGNVAVLEEQLSFLSISILLVKDWG